MLLKLPYSDLQLLRAKAFNLICLVIIIFLILIQKLL